jgi:rhomboid protease GluP
MMMQGAVKNMEYNRQSVRHISPVNTVIIAINVVVFIWLSLKGDTTNAWFMYQHGANFWPDVFSGHEYYRLLTCAFLHFGVQHLFNNMLVLAYIGDNLERALGSVKYTVLYLVAAVGSSLASAVWSMLTNEYTVSAGASGAVFGVVGALLFILVVNRGRLEDLSSRRLGLFAAFSVYHGISSAGIDNAAHIGGFIIGVMMAFLLYRRRRQW